MARPADFNINPRPRLTVSPRPPLVIMKSSHAFSAIRTEALATSGADAGARSDDERAPDAAAGAEGSHRPGDREEPDARGIPRRRRGGDPRGDAQPAGSRAGGRAGGRFDPRSDEWLRNRARGRRLCEREHRSRWRRKSKPIRSTRSISESFSTIT